MRAQAFSKTQIKGLQGLLQALRDEDVQMAEFDFSGPSPRLAKVLFNDSSGVSLKESSMDIEKARERAEKILEEQMIYGASE